MKDNEVCKEYARTEQIQDRGSYVRPQLVYLGRALELVKSGGNWIADSGSLQGSTPSC
ncbi:hypothetical protein Tter_1152 [Thermobaculum terrenum ATCC BAA-798]|uniref:Uncharacterized protein n=1 Tax=Thermobaculum terrenum (strain ATCC BAA-798 / CCMEE 7001 / YNP1) TaxID=525904 RepID=D1CB96_THET1|nr:hypothetical protein Tter_1152 [Thermobaculum terrenum ATCC BAA-798]